MDNPGKGQLSNEIDSVYWLPGYFFERLEIGIVPAPLFCFSFCFLIGTEGHDVCCILRDTCYLQVN